MPIKSIALQFFIFVSYWSNTFKTAFTSFWNKLYNINKTKFRKLSAKLILESTNCRNERATWVFFSFVSHTRTGLCNESRSVCHYDWKRRREKRKEKKRYYFRKRNTSAGERREEKIEMLISHRADGGQLCANAIPFSQVTRKTGHPPWSLRTRNGAPSLFLPPPPSSNPLPHTVSVCCALSVCVRVHLCTRTSAAWSGRADHHNVTTLPMTKHRCTSHFGGAAVRGSPPISRSSASRRCCCCGGGGGRASLYVILRVYVRIRDADCHYFAISVSPTPRIAFAVRPSGNIWTYWNTSIVSIYVLFSMLSSPSLSLYLYFYLYLLCSCLSRPPSRFVCLFFF